MNKKNSRALASATVLSLVLTTVVTTANVKAAPGKVTPIKGANRFETAANVAKANWKDGAENVILVSGNGIADALGASVLAEKLDAPIILTGSNELDEKAKEALETLKPKNVIAIGGKGVISEDLVSGLKKSYNVERLGGDTRFDTNLKIANYLVKQGVKADEVFVVNGGVGLADALTMAPVAASQGKILLIVGQDKSTAEDAIKFVKDHGSKVTVVGTDNMVTDEVYKLLGASKRVDGGSDRFATNLRILNEFKLAGEKLYVANGMGQDPIDALVASALAGKYNSPLVLTAGKDTSYTKNAIDYIDKNANEKTDLNTVGGEGVMPNEVIDGINNAVKSKEVKAAEKAVKAYEDAKITTSEEITAAKALKAPAEKAVEAVKDATQKSALTARIAAKDKAIKDAEAKMQLSVESVEAINGTVTVKLTKTPASIPVVGDFKLNATVAGKTSVVTPTAIKWDSTTNTAVLTVDKIGAIATAQAVSYSVGYKDTTATTSNSFTVAAVEKLATQDVQLLNARQLKVTFNRQVNEVSAETVGNYSIQNKAGKVKPLTATTTNDFGAKLELQNDKQTVIITLDKALTKEWNFHDGDSATVKVDAGVLDASGNPLGADYKKTLTVTDKTAPKLVSATSAAIATTNKVILKFSEPVNTTGAIVKVNGEVVTSLASGITPDTVIATTKSNLIAGTTYSVQIFNMKDSNDNVIEANPTTTKVAVTGDNTCLPISSVKATDDRTVRVVFGEPMNEATITAANLKVLNPNGTDLKGTDVTVTPTVVEGTNKTTWDFDIAQNTGMDIFGYDNTANLSLVFSSSMKDRVGNALKAETKTVTLKKDTVAPTVKNITFIHPGKKYDGKKCNNGAFVVTLDKDIDITKFENDKIKAAVDNTGADKQSTWFGDAIEAVGHSKLDNVVVLRLKAVPASTVKSVTLTLDKGLVKDTTNGANDSASTSVAINMSDSAAGYETNKPVVADAGLTTVPGVTNKIKVTFEDTKGTNNTGVDIGTVLDENNYQIDGVKLSSIKGAYITTESVSDKKGYTTTITLPEGTVSYPGTANHAFTITGIKDLAGNVMDKYVATADLTDNVKPDLKAGTAKVNSDGTLSLGFTEALATVPESDDFILYINGTKVAGKAFNDVDAAKKGNLKVEYINSGSAKDTAVLTVKTLKNGTLEFIDANNTGRYEDGVDVLVGNTSEGTQNGVVAGTYDLRTATKLAVKTTGATGKDLAGNVLKAETLIKVK